MEENQQTESIVSAQLNWDNYALRIVDEIEIPNRRENKKVKKE